MPGPGCGNKKPNWLEKMVRLQTETDVVGDGEWDTESDLVTQVGKPVASAVQFKDAIDAIIHYGQAKDGDIISVSSEPTEPPSLEITFSDADISSTESGVEWDVVDTTGVPEQTASNSSESGEFYNCYKVDGSVSSPLYRLPDGKIVEVVSEYVLYTGYAPSPEPEPVPDLPPPVPDQPPTAGGTANVMAVSIADGLVPPPNTPNSPDSAADTTTTVPVWELMEVPAPPLGPPPLYVRPPPVCRASGGPGISCGGK